MQLIPENIRAIGVTLDMAFNQALTSGSYTPIYTQIATVIPSTSGENLYPMADLLPQVREWLGERIVQNASAATYAIRNRKFEATIGVKEEDIEDDNLGLYNIRAQSLGQAFAEWPDDMVFEVVKANGLCYDGQNFFDTDHPAPGAVGQASSTVSNLFTVKALDQKNLEAAGVVTATWRNDAGKPMTVRFNTIMVPTNLVPAATRAMGQLAYGVTNPIQNRYSILEAPKLNDRPNEFYLLDTTRPLKPFIWQLRRAPRFVSKDNPTDENVFWRAEFLYGGDARGNAGYGLWMLAAKFIIDPNAPDLDALNP